MIRKLVQLAGFVFINLFLGVGLIAQELPEKIIITDFSSHNYGGKFNYIYELYLNEPNYKLYQTYLFESDFKKGNKKIKTKRKYLYSVSTTLISDLVVAIKNPKDSLGLADLGYTYDWFKLNNEAVYEIARSLWEKRWPDSPEWNSYQIDFIKEQLKTPKLLSKAVQTRFINSGIFFRRTKNNPFKIDLINKDQTVTIEPGFSYLGLPGKIGDRKYFNQKISAILYQIMPDNKGYNKKNLKNRAEESILEGIIDEVYQNYCEKKVHALAYHSFEKEINELKSRYKVWGFNKERSYTGNWEGEPRICMNLKDTTEKRNIRTRVCLTIEGSSLYTRDSVLNKMDYYFDLVNQVPFLLAFLDDNSKRTIDISFDNGSSLSAKVKTYQSGQCSWYKKACLIGANTAYLNNCVVFVLRDENNSRSNWVITPDLDVILYDYTGYGVYKYSSLDLGGEGSDGRDSCHYFELNGDLKKEE